MKKLLALTCFLAACGGQQNYQDDITGEIVADFKDNVSPEYIAELGKKLGVEFNPASNYSAVDKIYIADAVENEGYVIDQLRSNSNVEAADREEIYTIPESNMPNDVEG